MVLSKVNEDKNKTENVFGMIKSESYEWMKGQVDLPKGTYRLVISAYDIGGRGITQLGPITVLNHGCQLQGKC